MFDEMQFKVAFLFCKYWFYLVAHGKHFVQANVSDCYVMFSEKDQIVVAEVIYLVALYQSLYFRILFESPEIDEKEKRMAKPKPKKKPKVTLHLYYGTKSSVNFCTPTMWTMRIKSNSWFHWINTTACKVSKAIVVGKIIIWIV